MATERNVSMNRAKSWWLCLTTAVNHNAYISDTVRLSGSDEDADGAPRAHGPTPQVRLYLWQVRLQEEERETAITSRGVFSVTYDKPFIIYRKCLHRYYFLSMFHQNLSSCIIICTPFSIIFYASSSRSVLVHHRPSDP